MHSTGPRSAFDSIVLSKGLLECHLPHGGDFALFIGKCFLGLGLAVVFPSATAVVLVPGSRYA
jgi:hypothetical protein